jgi:hypothetical protein
MATRVKISLPTINDRIKSLAKFDNVVFSVTTRLKRLLLANWEKGKGADGKKMPALTEEYKKKKEGTGRSGIRNMLLSGNMVQDLAPVRKQDFVWMLKFMSAIERKKAQGNASKASNMMTPISDDINQKLQKYAFKLYKE